MRILYDHQVFSLQNVGGASRYHYELMRYLATVSDVNTELQLGISGTVFPFQQLASERSRVIRSRGSLPPGIWRYLANEILGNSRSTLVGALDVYHPTLYRCMPLVRARRVVVTHHDCVQERFPQLFPDARRIVRAKRRLYARADAIICVSASSRKDLLEFYNVDVAKTRVIHHGLNRMSRSAGAADRLRVQLPREYLLFVGSRAHYKNFNSLLQAFHATGLHESLQLLVLGGGTLTDEESVLAHKLNLRNRIVVFPVVTDALLAEAYAAATLFVYPSLCEGFGFPPLEAMASGCPTLVSHTSSLPEICRDAPFYFNPDDQSSLETALLRAVNDEKARKQAVERGIQVAAEYSWNKCGQSTLTLYRECQ
jgi:glycosyltransferase involved in cell wall biosynthesis